MVKLVKDLITNNLLLVETPFVRWVMSFLKTKLVMWQLIALEVCENKYVLKSQTFTVSMWTTHSVSCITAYTLVY